MTKLKVIGAAVLLGIAAFLATPRYVMAQGPYSAQIQRALAVFQANPPSFAAGMSTTTSSPFSVIYTGTTNPSNYYTNALFSSVVTQANGLVFATGVNHYYLYEPTDSDASGLSRIATNSYLETRGTQNLSSFLYAFKGRVIHLGTGTVGTLIGGQGLAYNGHAGEQGTTGGSVTNVYGLNAQTFQQSTLGNTGTAYGTFSSVESDYGTVTTAYGSYAQTTGGAPGVITTAYGSYVGSMYGTTKWSFYASDATAPSFFAGSTTTPTVNYTTKINGSGFTFSNIGTTLTANGDMAYCTDCTIANPCASGGTGALAKRLNGVNVCN